MRYIEGDNHALNAIGLIEEANREMSMFIEELIERKMDNQAELAHDARCKLLREATNIRYLWHMMYDHDHNNA